MQNKSIMLVYPQINKVALQLGSIKIYWYGIMYILSFIVAWFLARYRVLNKMSPDWAIDEVDDLIFYCALGVIIGGRMGQMLFYDYANFFHDPLVFFKIWQGGMSFHGGLLGVMTSCFIFAKKHDKKFFTVSDFVAPLVPLGLAFGRLGNFINGELWGRITDVPWAMVFPDAGPMPRHPSQLYEFLLEGIILFIFLWIYSRRKRSRMAVSAMFLLGYGIMRFFVEFFREPEFQYGYGFIAFGWLTMGQLLSLPMIIVGTIMSLKAHANTPQIK